MNARLQEMQDILEHLESKFDRTEKELMKTRKENVELESELQKQTKERIELIGQIQQQQEVLEGFEHEMKAMQEELTNVSADCLFYKEKYSEM